MIKHAVEFPAVALRISRSSGLHFKERRTIAFRFFAEFMPEFFHAADFEFAGTSKEIALSVSAREASGSVTVGPRGEPPRNPPGEHLRNPPGDQPPSGGGKHRTGHPDGRYLQGKCPDSVAPDERFSLHVSIVVGPGDVMLKDFEVPEGGKPLLLEADAPGLRIFSPKRQVVVVPVVGDSEPVTFELRANEPGRRRISISAWDDGSCLGQLIIEVAVRADARVREDQTARGDMRFGRIDGEVTLVVRRDEARRYRFEFRDVDNPAEVKGMLKYDPGSAVERLLARLDGLARGGRYPTGLARDYLVNAGLELWEELIPEGLRRQFWERQGRIQHLTILSEADTVPWELLYPQDIGHEAGFLVEQFPVTRAVFDRLPPRSLRLRPACFVLPHGSPPEADIEVAALHMLLDPDRPHADTVATLPPLLELIHKGDFGVLHFACHSRFDPEDGSTIHLDCPFLPMQLTKAGSDRTLAAHTPLIFINACRSALGVASYNRLDSWAEKFLRAGAGAFIGSLWAVSDGAAREFAMELYRRLQSGQALGAAVMSARTAAASLPGDPTWLAYAAYGNSLAKVDTLPG